MPRLVRKNRHSWALRHAAVWLLGFCSLAVARLQYNVDEEFVTKASHAKPWFASDATVFGRVLPVSPVSIFLIMLLLVRITCGRNSKRKKSSADIGNPYSPCEDCKFPPRRLHGKSQSKWMVWKLPALTSRRAVGAPTHEDTEGGTDHLTTCQDISKTCPVSANSKQPRKDTPNPLKELAMLMGSRLGHSFSFLTRIRKSIQKRVAKRLNPDATIADLGETSQPIYDKERGIWLLPGDDPEEKSKAIAPPPIAPLVTDQKHPSSPARRDDPFAAFMAPPKRNVASFGRAKSTGLSGGTPPLGPSHVKRPVSAGSAPPMQYKVFQPKPKPKKKNGSTTT